MKQYSKQIILFTMALVIFITGVGVNIVEYCCTRCKATPFYSVHTNCCNKLQPHESKNTNAADCCTEMKHECEESLHLEDNTACNLSVKSGCCTIHRTSIDIEHVHIKYHLKKPIFYLFNLCYTFKPNINPLYSKHCGSALRYKAIDENQPCDYLHFIKVLII